MASIPVSRLFSNGSLFVSGSFDEVTLSGTGVAYRIDVDGIVYANALDEITLNPINNGLARKLYSNGTLMIAGIFDEVTGIT
jgi:hypothetical protein